MPRAVFRSALVPALIFLVVVPLQSRAADPAVSIQWRTDYNTARKESAETGLPILIQIGTEDCFYCKKMEASTFRDVAVLGMMNGFIPLKIDGNKETTLVKTLKIQLYPTTVLAGADGTIHAFVQGYVAVDQFKEQLKRTTDLVAGDTKSFHEMAEVTAAIKAGEYAKALPLLQRLAIVSKGKAAEPRVSELLTEVEKVAAARLTRANSLLSAGKNDDAVAALNDVVKVFPGTTASSRAESHLIALGANKLDRVAISLRAPTLMTAARDLARAGAYSEALDVCQLLGTTSEAKAAQTLASEIKTDPTRLAVAARQTNEKAAALQSALGDAHALKGEYAEAVKCYELAILFSPNSPTATAATAQLVKLRGSVPVVPAVRSK
ncbi:tetratricopeptide repeat protein [Limnoglobus roseus]|uniref:Tetratricopeptide repeat protein n=1 Tax=Limnoglobus roseus TaxID=2598579 RepID=A0A5C1ALG6_9BACT|nr:tetratricopeptide repeat protein [Limnoglobus roseus]QEL18816.1 hypothetical protein PX52LOC_05856 [Limnoglobus roseus]